MPSIKKVGEHVELEIERFDGGLNTKDSKSRIEPFESPDCLNVVFDDQGSVATRYGSKVFNTSVAETGSSVIDGLASYKGTMACWAGGDMFRASGTTFVTVASAQGQFSSGAKVAWSVYQDILFCSDGTNGPYRWEGGQSFYQMGIATPSACTGVSAGSLGGVEAGTYAYKVAYQNSHVVDGEAGSASADFTLTGAASVTVSDIPIGAASHGVAKRKIYRASNTSDGPYRLVHTLEDNTTTTFQDNVGATTWAVGALPTADATAPTPFTTVREHKNRLFFDDSSNRTRFRYTKFQTPFISEAENFVYTGHGDGSNIQAIGVQDDLVTFFKSNSIWVTAINDASDDLTWQTIKLPANFGIVGPWAFWEGDGFILFCGRGGDKALPGKLSGFHILSGVSVSDVANNQLRTKSIAKNIEPNLLAISSGDYANISMAGFNNKVYVAFATSADSQNAHMWWFDINRVVDDDIGSWSLWDGITVTPLLVHSGNLYGGSALADGQVVQLEVADQYNDLGSAINSYFWTKEFGGEASIESWIKDWRFINLWYGLLGDWDMNVTVRRDGESGSGSRVQKLNVNQGGNNWASAGTSMMWWSSAAAGSAASSQLWGGGSSDNEEQFSVGLINGRRIQVRFDNQNTADQAFKVHSMKTLMNLRRQR